VLYTALLASPTPTPGPDADLVTPGIWGFVITFAVIVAVVVLIIDMARRMRQVTYRAQVREQLENERASKD
jgi:hypothetical protein